MTKPTLSDLERLACQAAPTNAFYSNYPERLQTKLQRKNRQISRIERLLPNIASDQRASFESLLSRHKGPHEIQAELNEVKRQSIVSKLRINNLTVCIE